MDIKIYKTKGIDDQLWQQIVEGYINSFDNHQITKDELISGYTSNHLGFSYHAISFDGSKVAGFNSIVPYYYWHNNEKVILGLSGTTFVLKEYRKDAFIFYDLYMALKEHCVKENIIAFLGVPNANSYKYSIKLLKCKEIGRLSYYILPMKISKIINKPALRFLNIFSFLYSLLNLILSYIFSSLFNTKERSTPYRLAVDDSFLDIRFKDAHYKTQKKGKYRFTYTLSDENSVRTTYLMDFRQNNIKTFKSLLRAIWYVYKHESVDIIMYIGTLNIKQMLLTKVPSKFEPRILPFTINFLDIEDKEKYKDINIYRNWDFSLMGLDVR